MANIPSTLGRFFALARSVILSPLVLFTVIAIAATVIGLRILRNEAAEQQRQAEIDRLETFALSLREHVEQAVLRGDDRLRLMRQVFFEDDKRHRKLNALLDKFNKTLDQ